MSDYLKTFVTVFVLLFAAGPLHVLADTAVEIDQDADTALQKLFRSSPVAEDLMKVSRGVLIFPNIIKAGLVIGGQYGEGVLRVDGESAGYYKTVAGSYGLQAGAQSFGYVMFFMTDSALEHLSKSNGWEVGVGPSLVVVDEGMAKTLTTTTVKEDIYAFVFGQKGLMAGLGIQGSKISSITPE